MKNQPITARDTGMSTLEPHSTTDGTALDALAVAGAPA
jgi:hypothetical protein